MYKCLHETIVKCRDILNLVLKMVFVLNELPNINFTILDLKWPMHRSSLNFIVRMRRQLYRKESQLELRTYLVLSGF